MKLLSLCALLTLHVGHACAMEKTSTLVPANEMLELLQEDFPGRELTLTGENGTVTVRIWRDTLLDEIDAPIYIKMPICHVVAFDETQNVFAGKTIIDCLPEQFSSEGSAVIGPDGYRWVPTRLSIHE